MSDHYYPTPGRDRDALSPEWRRAHPGFTVTTLSPMEFKALRLAATGLIYKEIAVVLGNSEQTTKNHLFSVRRKLGAQSTIEAFVILGWLQAPEASGALVRIDLNGQCSALLDLAARATAAAETLGVH